MCCGYLTGPPKFPVPDVFSSWGSVRTLDETFLFQTRVYQRLLFCVGVVLMFSKERGAEAWSFGLDTPLGASSALTFVSLLSAAPTLLISALVLTGIAALFQSIPLKYQPRATQFCVDLGAGYLRYGPYPKEICGIALVGFLVDRHSSGVCSAVRRTAQQRVQACCIDSPCSAGLLLPDESCASRPFVRRPSKFKFARSSHLCVVSSTERTSRGHRRSAGQTERPARIA